MATNRDVIKRIFTGKSVFARNCEPVSPAKVAQAFNEVSCLIEEDSADSIFRSKLIGTVAARSTGYLHESYASPLSTPLVVPMTNRKYLTVNKPTRVVTSMSALLTPKDAPPPVAERDVASPTLTPVANATATPLSPTRAGASVHGVATTIPVFGYLVRVQWSLSDLATSMRLDFTSPALTGVATIAPTSDECTEMWLFIPAASGTAPAASGSTLVLNHARTHGSAASFTATVYSGASPATTPGGWTVFVKAVDFTEELVDTMLPVFNNGRFS